MRGWRGWLAASGAGLAVVAGGCGDPPARRSRSSMSALLDGLEESREIDTTRLRRTVDLMTDPAMRGRAADDMPVSLVDWLTTRLADAGFYGAIRTPEGVGYAQGVSVPRPEGGAVEGANVVGVGLGFGELAREAVIVVAHYDGQGIDATGEIRPGGDDNASGVSAALAAARGMTFRGSRAIVTLFADLTGGPVVRATPCRSVVVLLTTGEEVGLLGARTFIDRLDQLSAKTAEGLVVGLAPVAFVNLDMVGRLGDTKLGVYGTDTHPGWWEWTKQAAKDTPVRIARHETFPGSGDHDVFAEAGYPTVLLHTGNHADRHTPDDTAERVDFEGVARVAEFTAALVRQLAVAPDLAAPPGLAPGGVE